MKLLRVSAIWCPACILMRPIYESIIKENNLVSEELDYDFDEDKVKQLNIGNTLPVAILYDGDHELLRICGEKKYEEISLKIREFL